MPAVSTAVLKWARKTSGLSVDEVVAKLGWKSLEKFEAIEAGKAEPTRANLTKLAEIYRKPLTAMYLLQPPKVVEVAHDFRMLADPDRHAEQILQALVRDVQVRQDIVRTALEEADEAVFLDFPGSITIRSKPPAIAQSIAKQIGFSGLEFAQCKNVDDAFARLRQAVEASGIYVLIESNLGSHHTNIGAGVFRGFALSDRVAPFVVINAKDSKAAWAFTLVHEITHVWLGESALSGYDSKAEVEKFCDEVAATFLLDGLNLAEVYLDKSKAVPSIAASVSELANRRNLSRRMIAYNLMKLGRLSSDEYIALVRLFAAPKIQANVEADGDSGGPSYYVLRRHRLGNRLISAVDRFMSEGLLTSTRAAKVLGVKPTAVYKTLEPRQAA